MRSIRVALKNNAYDIVVGSGVLSKLPDYLKKLGLGPDAVIITNPLVRRLHGRALASALTKGGFVPRFFEAADSEKSKSAAVAFRLIGQIARYAADKKVVVIAFGGGVIGDLAGLVAAVYKRGVPLVQIPTTLLAQVDSSIGGKVAVDLPEGKNLVGAFYQPKLVLADSTLLSTLSERQVRNGLAEVVKYGVIRDAALFTFLEKHYAGLVANEPELMAQVVLKCATIKARVVSVDEKETKGVRVILNFGHTIGHAIETAAGYKRYHHGEGVALGMRAACSLSCDLKLMKPLEAERVDTLLTAIGLPETIQGVTLAAVLSSMVFDKKFSGKKNRFVLVRKIGDVIVRENIPEPLIRNAIQNLLT